MIPVTIKVIKNASKLNPPVPEIVADTSTLVPGAPAKESGNLIPIE